MIISQHCEKYDMDIRFLTKSHCELRKENRCEPGQCKHFGIRFYREAA
ncbi:MAG: hypothetical protein ABOK23_00350 [Candidatus Methanoperedens sp.]